MKLYIYDMSLNSNYHDASTWNAQVHEVFHQHSDFLNRAVQHGRILFMGQTDTAPMDNYGVVLFEAENQEDADDFIRSDPAIARGIMVGRAFPFKLVKVSDQARKWQAH